jgi:hypothetical protein
VVDHGVGIVERSIVVNTMIQKQVSYSKQQKINTHRSAVRKSKVSDKRTIVQGVILAIVQSGGSLK